MKKPQAKPPEKECTACSSAGHLEAVKPTKPTVRIHPPQCRKDAIGKLAELTGSDRTKIIAKDLIGKIVDLATMRA